MNVSWPPRLGVGDRVRFEGRAWVVSGFDHRRVQLTDPRGGLTRLTVPQLVSRGDFGVLENGPRSPSVLVLPATGEILEQARWWERHIAEVITGLPPGAEEGAAPRPEFDPAVRSLAEREAAKAAELAAEGVPGTSARTVRRRRQHYQAQGVEGLIDGRAARKRAPGSRQDPRVLEVLMMIIADDIGQGRTTSAEGYRRATGSMLEMLYGAGGVKLPSRSTFQRLVKELVSLHGRASGIPVADKDGIQSSRPGERIYVDTIALVLPPHLSQLTPHRVLMTVAVDELTWTVCTVMVRSARRPLEGPLLLARLCHPPALRDTDSGAREEAMPLIIPESLLLDRQSLRQPRAFTDACRCLGIKVVPPEPVGKGLGERVVGQIGSLFNAELAVLEGERIPDEASLITWLQNRAEQWVASVWQHQPQWGLRTLVGHGRQSTPSSAYDACVARLGWVHLPPAGHAPHAFLPSAKRRVARNGVHVEGRRYDCPDLDPFRTATSRTPGDPTPRVQVRFDPHDVHQVWVQPEDSKWIRVPLAGAKPLRRPSRLADSENMAFREGWNSLTDRMPSPQPLPHSDRQRLAYHAQLPILRTPFLQEVLRLGDRLTVLNQAAVGGRHGLLITGPPGSGKTTSLQELGRHFEHVDRFRHGRGRFRPIPAVYLRIHPGDSTRTVLFSLAGLLPTPTLPRRASTAAASEAVREALSLSGTSVVLVDDAFAVEGSSRRGPCPVDDLLYLADQVQATFVYAGLDGQENSLTTAFRPDQGRLTHLRAAPVPNDAGWELLVGTLDQALRLHRHRPGSLVRLAPVLHDRTGGWPGALAHLVRSAAIEAILTGSEEITEQDLAVIAV